MRHGIKLSKAAVKSGSICRIPAPGCLRQTFGHLVHSDVYHPPATIVSSSLDAATMYSSSSPNLPVGHILHDIRPAEVRQLRVHALQAANASSCQKIPGKAVIVGSFMVVILSACAGLEHGRQPILQAARLVEENVLGLDIPGPTGLQPGTQPDELIKITIVKLIKTAIMTTIITIIIFMITKACTSSLPSLILQRASFLQGRGNGPSAWMSEFCILSAVTSERSRHEEMKPDGDSNFSPIWEFPKIGDPNIVP